MIKRYLSTDIQKCLEFYPAVAILGPRQVGKTTLALEIAKTRSSIYLDLHNPIDFQKLQDPEHYLSMHSDKLVILDEVQQYPALFKRLRGVIDKYRQEAKANGRFLILGSASNDLLRQSSESLAGRISYMELSSLTALETDSQGPLSKLWLRGGFPESYQAGSESKSRHWRSNFIKTYVERDIPQLGSRIPASTLMRFWTMLAHNQGELFNASKLAASLGVKSISVGRYLDLMVDLLLVRRLQPWFGNTKKRLVKSPRVYIRDSGILHSLIKVSDYEEILGHPILGKSWEGFVLENLISLLGLNEEAYFYRTSAGAEIDLLIRLASGELWAIEVKASRSPSISKGFHIACKDLGAVRKLVVYPGEDSFSMGDGIFVLPLIACMQQLADRIREDS